MRLPGRQYSEFRCTESTPKRQLETNATMPGEPPPFRRRSMIRASVLARKSNAAAAASPIHSGSNPKLRRSRYPTLPGSRSTFSNP